jgi:hypothetical protein
MVSNRSLDVQKLFSVIRDGSGSVMYIISKTNMLQTKQMNEQKNTTGWETSAFFSGAILSIMGRHSNMSASVESEGIFKQ